MSGLLLVHAVMRADTAPAFAGRSLDDGMPLTLIVERGLAALASRLPDGVGETIFTQPNDAARIAVRHDSLLTEVARAVDLAPVRLGAVHASEDAVRSMLREGSISFEAALLHVAGAAEFGMKLLPSDETSAAPEADQPATGRSYLRQRADAAAALRTRAEQAQQLAADVFHQVTALARDHVFAPPRSHALADQEKRLLLAALLVDRKRLAAFEAAVIAAQDRVTKEGFRLVVVGPLPPYSFVGRAMEQGAAA